MCARNLVCGIRSANKISLGTKECVGFLEKAWKGLGDRLLDELLNRTRW
jgi:hypothetical protein